MKNIGLPHDTFRSRDSHKCVMIHIDAHQQYNNKYTQAKQW